MALSPPWRANRVEPGTTEASAILDNRRRLFRCTCWRSGRASAPDHRQSDRGIAPAGHAHLRICVVPSS